MGSKKGSLQYHQTACTSTRLRARCNTRSSRLWRLSMKENPMVLLRSTCRTAKSIANPNPTKHAPFAVKRAQSKSDSSSKSNTKSTIPLILTHELHPAAGKTSKSTRARPRRPPGHHHLRPPLDVRERYEGRAGQAIPRAVGQGVHPPETRDPDPLGVKGGLMKPESAPGADLLRHTSGPTTMTSPTLRDISKYTSPPVPLGLCQRPPARMVPGVLRRSWWIDTDLPHQRRVGTLRLNLPQHTRPGTQGGLRPGLEPAGQRDDSEHVGRRRFGAWPVWCPRNEGLLRSSRERRWEGVVATLCKVWWNR